MGVTYIFDTECTDRDEKREVIETGLIRLTPEMDLAGESDRICLTEFTQFAPQRFKPAKPTTMGALAVHHILPSELEGCPPSSEFRLPGDCTYIVGHSIDFDWEAIGRPDVKRICTHAMSDWVYPEADSRSLVALTYHVKGATALTRDLVRNAHSAAHDCYLAMLLLTDILAKKPEITTWRALWEFSEECRIPRTCPMQKYKGVPLDELVDIDPGFASWALRLPDLDPYYRRGLERAFERQHERRYGNREEVDQHTDDCRDEIPF